MNPGYLETLKKLVDKGQIQSEFELKVLASIFHTSLTSEFPQSVSSEHKDWGLQQLERDLLKAYRILSYGRFI